MFWPTDSFSSNSIGTILKSSASFELNSFDKAFACSFFHRDLDKFKLVEALSRFMAYATYATIILSLPMNLASRGAILRWSFRPWNACSNSLLHLNFFHHFNTWKKREYLPLTWDTSLLKVAILLVRLCTSFGLDRDHIFMRAWILLGFASISRWLTV